MVRSLSSIKMEVRLLSTLTNTLTDSSAVDVKHTNLTYNQNITSGAYAANQADRSWQSTDRILLSGATETIDFYDLGTLDIGGGAGNDGTGQQVRFEEIVGVAIVNENAASAAGELEIEPGAANGWDPIGIHTNALGGSLKGQGCFFKSQVADPGYLVTDASSHTVKFTANGGDVTYSVYLMGRSDIEESSSSSISTSSSSISTSSSSSSQSSVSTSSLSSTSSYSSVSTSSSSSSQSSISTSSSSISTSSSSQSSISTSSISTSSSSVSTSSSSSSDV